MNERPTSEELAILSRAFESGDVENICLAIGSAVKAYNISDVARTAGLSRPSVYRAFGGGSQRPNLTTLLGVLDAMGLYLKVAAKKRGDRAQASRTR
jgi:probable addiction module antidote protein